MVWHLQTTDWRLSLRLKNALVSAWISAGVICRMLELLILVEFLVICMTLANIYVQYMLFAGWEGHMVINCDQGLENAARGRRREKHRIPRHYSATVTNSQANSHNFKQSIEYTYGDFPCHFKVNSNKPALTFRRWQSKTA